MKPIRILSIDGGGIRGLIPALILAEIEKRTGKPICELFDIIAGTSTGGMIALGVTIPGEGGQPKFAATDLVGLYRDEGHKIFEQSLWEKLNSVRDNAFDHENLEGLLKDYFEDAELKDAMSHIIITAYDIERRSTFTFDSELARQNPAENFLVREAARATSAAPTYFEPTQVGQDVRYSLVDGGVFANNPSMLAYVEAKKRHNKWKFAAAEEEIDGPIVVERQLSTAAAKASEIDENFIMLSLGTGSSRKAYAFNDAKTWGLVGWVRPIVDILMQGTAETVHYQMKHLLPPRLDGTNRYFRMDTQILAEHGEMSDTSPEMMTALANYASEIILRQSSAIEDLCAQLTA